MKKMFSISLLCLMACMGTALNGANANEIAFGEKWSARLSKGLAENNLGPVFSSFLHTLLQKRNPDNLTQDVSARLNLPGTVMDLAHQLSTANTISDEEFTAISEAAAFLRWLNEYENADLGIAASQTNKEKGDALWANLETASRAALAAESSSSSSSAAPAAASSSPTPSAAVKSLSVKDVKNLFGKATRGEKISAEDIQALRANTSTRAKNTLKVIAQKAKR